MLVKIKTEIFLARLTQESVAHVMGIHPALFSRILRDLRAMPEDFEERAIEAIDLLKRAERAAQEAREKILAETVSAQD